MGWVSRWLGTQSPPQKRFDEEAYVREQREENERAWDFLYTNYPPLPGTEAKQARHRELCRRENPTEEQEQESAALFLELFPQARPPERGEG